MFQYLWQSFSKEPFVEEKNQQFCKRLFPPFSASHLKYLNGCNFLGFFFGFCFQAINPTQHSKHFEATEEQQCQLPGHD